MDPKQFFHSTKMSQGENENTEALTSLAKPIGAKIQEGAAKTKALYASPRIYRVPEDLREMKQRAYIPRLIAIGPLHYKDQHLQTPMQQVKMHYTDCLFFRLAEGTTDVGERNNIKGAALLNCVAKMKECNDRAKSYYAEEVPLVDKAKSYHVEEVPLVDKAKIYLVQEVPLVDKAKSYPVQEVPQVDKAKKHDPEEADDSEMVEADDREMVEMMLVDGCFILELLYSSYLKQIKSKEQKPESGGDGGNSKASSSFPQPANGEEDGSNCSSGFVDPILDIILTEIIVKQDLLLLENQIPFFVLEYLFELTVAQIPGDQTKPSLTDYVLSYFHHIMCPYGDNSEDENSKKKASCSPSECVFWVNKMSSSGKAEEYYHILHFLHDHYASGCKSEVATGVPRASPGKKFTELEVFASDLDYAGVKFLPSKETNLFDVKFEEPKDPFRFFRSARFEIPTLEVHDLTEPFLRNLIALEQCCPGVDRHFTSYAKFMDMLIDSKDDIKVLTKAKVIHNHLGADMDVCDLFNKLCKEVVTPVDSIFNDKFQEAYNYSQHRWPKWWAYWKRTYIETPWGIVAFSLAIIAFGITVTNFVRGFLE